MITQLSAFNLCLSTFDAAVQEIARAGFDQLAVYFTRSQFAKALHELDDFEVEEIAHKAALNDLRIAAVGGPSNLLTKEGTTELKQALRVAGALEAEVFDTGSLSFQGKEPDQLARETRLFCDNLRRVGDVAGEKGMVICLETHGGMTGTPQRCLQAMAEINHPNVGIGFDPANIVYYEGADPFEDLDELLPFIGHLHVKDQVGGRDAANFPTVGAGEIDYATLLPQVVEGGYGGCLSVERVSGETDEERADELVKAYEFLAQAVG
jgi:sugar phosphate isomerase/epimerase